MINRELIRIKIVQLTYAYYQNGNKNIDNAEKELLFSLSKAYDLYNYLLELIVAITREERHRVEISANRAEREGGEALSQKFAYNKFAVQLEENKTLNEFIETQKLTWNEDIEFIRKLCNQIEQSETFKDYMGDTDESYDADRELWRKLYKQLIQNNDELDAILEEKSLYWNDDKEIVDTFVIKTIKRFDPANKNNQELLPEYKDEEDRDFARKLFRATILNADQYQRYMSETSRNWDFSRLAYMDVVIMQIAIAELITFPNVPASVSINEYVELAKLYSTVQSGRYVNGMLDAIARHLNEISIINKPMEEPKIRRPFHSDEEYQRNNDAPQRERIRFEHKSNNKSNEAETQETKEDVEVIDKTEQE
jgi:N utilization substance protein B